MNSNPIPGVSGVNHNGGGTVNGSGNTSIINGGMNGGNNNASQGAMLLASQKEMSNLTRATCSFLQEAGIQLRLPQLTIATAIVFFHKYFACRAHQHHDQHVKLFLERFVYIFENV